MDREINRKSKIYQAWAINYIREKIKTVEKSRGSHLEKTGHSDIIEALLST